MQVQWYPGHMAKAKRQLAERLRQVDLVVEVLDARAPASTLNPDLEELFCDKQVLYVLNKTDLADPAVTERWLRKFQEDGREAFAYSAVQEGGAPLEARVREATAEIISRFKEKGMNKTIRGLVAGIPNVGKSAVLNRLVGAKRMKEGNKPGVTRSLQWAKIGPYLEMLDSPGMLWPKLEEDEQGAALALIGSVPLNLLDEEELAFYLIELLASADPGALRRRFDINPEQLEPAEVLDEICRRRGFLLKGGVLDTERGSKTLLDEFKNGRLGPVSLEAPSFS